MTEVISVRFRSGCKNYYFDPKGLTVKMGDQVIVETAQGPEFATCTEGNHDVEESTIVKPLAALLRMATENDLRTVEYNRKRENEAFDICEKKIAEHKLEMKLVNVSCGFDGSKIVFFFTADGRVDFRELVRDLASVFRARIELRQIGVRDEAKMIGGLGICGQPFCCSRFLDGFLPVSIKMAKTQNLSLNPAKISGTCGRLMCCLKYEQNAYEDATKRMPKQESFVQTPDGPGNVKSVDLLRERVKVSLDSAPPAEPLKCYHNCEICVLRNGKGTREGIEVPAQRPERYVEPKREGEDELRAITPVITEPFYMGTRLEDAELAPTREKIGGPESAEKRHRRRGRSGRGGQKPESQRSEPHANESGREGRPAGKSGNPGGGRPGGQSGGRPNGGQGGGQRRRNGQGGKTQGERQGQGEPQIQKPRPAPQQPKAAEGAGAPEQAAKRRRPHHRGGRRHHGEDGAPTAPKTE